MSDERAERIADFIAPLRVRPGSKVRLERDFDPRYKAGLKKRDGIELLQTGVSLLAEYQERLAAQDTYGVVLCLQALDAGGKDGTIRHVMSGVNPQGVRVSSFKVPSAEELDHDYLWRYAQRLPARGEIAIFNRSHYEEVLVVRVHPEILLRQRLPEIAGGRGLWDGRYREINRWERYLTDNGFKVVKIFLNLSKEEQRTRFLKRIDRPEKNWKFSAADVRERRRWDDYQHAFSDMLSATSTKWAPWYVVPADRKWFARICAAAILAHTLIDIDPQYPDVGDEARKDLLVTKRDLEREALPGHRPIRTPTGIRRPRGPPGGEAGGRRSGASTCRSGARPARTHPWPRIGGRTMTVRSNAVGEQPRASGDGWYSHAPEEVVAAFGVDPAVGLSAGRAAELLTAHGPNALPEEKGLRPGAGSSSSTAVTCRSSLWPRRSSRCSSRSGPPRSC